MSKKRNTQKDNKENISTKALTSKIWIVSVILVVALLFITIFYIFSSSSYPETIDKACIKDNCYDIEIADTPKERAKGLMYKEKLPIGSGMLFKYSKTKSPENLGFWMKNTNIPLDILWISKEKKIVDTKENFEPCVINNCKIVYPKEKAQYVLEVNSGEVENNNIKLGQKVYFKTK